MQKHGGKCENPELIVNILLEKQKCALRTRILILKVNTKSLKIISKMTSSPH